MNVDSLRVRLLIPLLVVALPVSVIWGVQILSEYRTAQQRLALEIRHLADMAVQVERQRIDAANRFMKALAQTAEFRTISPECQAILDYQALDTDGYTTVGLMDTKGTIICRIGTAPRVGSVIDDPWVREALRTPGLTAQGYRLGPVSGRPARPMGYVMSDAANRPMGAVFVGLSLRWLADLNPSQHLPAGSHVTVFDEAGTILGRYPEDGYVGKTLPDATFVRLAADGRDHLLEAGVGLDGALRLYAIEPLFPASGAGSARVYVGVSIPEATLYAAPRVQMLQMTATLLGMLALALWLAWRIATRSVEQPIREAVQIARQIGQGDLEVRAGALHGSREVRALGRALGHMAAALQRHRNQMEAAQKLAGLGNWRWPLHDGTAEWSDEMYEIFGVSRHDFVPTLEAILAHVHPDDRAYVEAQIQNALATGRTHHFQARILVGERVRHCRCIAQSDAVTDGKPPRLIGVIHDITEMQETYDQLRQAQKMEAIGRLTGGIAHDFNNLLQVVLASAEMMADEEIPLTPKDQRAMAATICQAAERGANLTRRLLSFSRQQDIEAASVDVNALVRDMQRMLERTLGEDIVIETALADAPWPVWADGAQLEAAILNLAVNARDAMPGGGRLVIETANVVLDEDYAVRAGVAAGDYVAVSVSDTGCGMAPNVMARVFEPFFTTKEVGKGTGLGLPMVYGFVRRSGGHVKVYSDVGVGTTVRLYFPRQTAAERPDGPADRGEAPPRGTETVLVVEDDDLVAVVTCERLRNLGYTVLHARTGPEAVALLEQGVAIDALVTDMVMPGGMSGADVIRRFRERRPDLPAIATSGYALAAAVRNGSLPPGTVMLGKPHRLAELAKTVRTCLDQPVRVSAASDA
ncbi:MAG TPA: ATP-binding protein [Azospirillum sp.]|nr:ATP-binding protein [Azospirillum sp.]